MIEWVSLKSPGIRVRGRADYRVYCHCHVILWYVGYGGCADTGKLAEKWGMTHETGSRVNEGCFVVTVDFLWG
jgi:hypothetical protein